METLEATKLSEIKLSAFLTIGDSRNDLRKYFRSTLEDEYNRAKEIDTSLLEEQPSLREKIIDLNFILSNDEDLKEILDQPRSDYYLSYLFIYFELEKIIEVMKKMKAACPEDFIDIHIDAKESYSKLFMRGAPLSNLASATIATLNEKSSIQNLLQGLKANNFLYWVEKIKKSDSFSEVKIFAYSKSKRYKGAILPFEITITRPNIYLHQLICGNDEGGEIEQFKNAEACNLIYENYIKSQKNVDVLFSQLCGNNILSSKEIELCTKGTWIEENGQVSLINGSADSKIEFIDAVNQSKNGFRVYNGILHYADRSYSWSKTQFPTNEDYIIRGEMYLTPDSGIDIALGPNIEYWGQSNEKSWTLMIGVNELWIRERCFHDTLFFDNKRNSPLREFFPFELRIQNKNVTVSVNGENLPEIFPLNFDSFRLGLINFNNQPPCFLRKLEIERISKSQSS